MGKKSKIEAAVFVKAWQEAESLDDLAKKLGAKAQSLRSRSVYYRKQGVELKKYPRTGRGTTLDIAELNKLARASAPKDAPKATKKRAAKKR